MSRGLVVVGLAILLASLIGPVAASATTATVSPPIVVQQSSSPSSCCVATWTTSVTCPTGRYAIGGGGAVGGSPSDAALNASAPTGSPPTGWTVSAEGPGQGLSFTTTVTAYAVCH
jgi:hypothetical protein